MVCEMRNAQQGCGFGIFSDSSLTSLSEMNFAPRGNNWTISDNFGGGYGNGSGGGFEERRYRVCTVCVVGERGFILTH